MLLVLLVTCWVLATCQQALAQNLICDGQVRTINMAQAPFPESPPSRADAMGRTPWVGPAEFTCTRPLAGTSQSCGSKALDRCGDIQFAPILQGSGPTPGIIPPSNPLLFSLRPESNAYLTFLQFRAGDIGTGGAQIVGNYGAGSNLAPVTTSFSWATNGPTQSPDGNVVFDVCTNCTIGFGVKDLEVRAAAGAGFRSVALSQMFPDTRCEGSGVNNDGILWTGMTYSCVEPTCGDTDLNTEGSQRFVCQQPFIFNNDAVNVRNPSTATCCTRTSSPPASPPTSPPTPLSICADVGFGFPFACPVGTEYDSSRGSVSPPSVQACCVAATCSNITPVSAPGTRFTCRPGTDYNDAADSTAPPSQDACCLVPAVGTCSAPDPNLPSTPFDCPENTEYNPETGSTSPPTAANCCLPRTCGNLQPVTNPNGVRFDCPEGSVFEDTASDASPPTAENCCQDSEATCGNTNPSQPGQRFDCAPQLFNQSAINLPPSRAACCFDLPDIPQSDVDMSITKTVSPAANDAGTLSTLQPVGSEFTFTLTVRMNALAGAEARDVVVTDRLPRGLTVKRLRERPADDACSFTARLVTCTWARFVPSDVKTITITATGIQAGEWVNPAEVTTSDRDTDPSNNRDTARARVTGACCFSGGGNCRNTLPDRCQPPNEFTDDETCDTARCEQPAPTPRVGACCIITNGGATCRNRVSRLDCQGRWHRDRLCSEITCAVAAPTGACCDPVDGTCRNGATRAECPARATWQLGGRCGVDNFCTGSCCNPAAGSCQENISKNACRAPSRWTLYGRCDQVTCPAPGPNPVCIPAWYGCRPGGADECCPGYSCQPTYPNCVVGPYACKPDRQACVPAGGECGGNSGGCCCEGHACRWSASRGMGTCWIMIGGCTSNGDTCRDDLGCCRGSRCKSGRCAPAVCYRPCKSFECFKEREQDCHAFYAAAASE